MFSKKSIGQWMVIAGLTEIAGSTILHGLDLISETNFRICIAAGILIELFALVVILKRNEI